MILQNLFGLDNSLQVPSIPYMGNKRKLATRIINTIIDLKGNDFNHFYDLFGGGGSISISSLNLWDKTIHYNEINTAIYNLMKRIQGGGNIPYDWITREKFFEALKKDDWYSGMIQSCWSFGNNSAKGYLYGKDIEGLKYTAHLVCVEKDKEALKKLEDISGFKIKLNLKKEPQQIRLQLKKVIECLGGEILDIQHLERLNLIEHLRRLQHLERLQRLQRLQHLQHLERLQLTSLSYSDVKIKENSIIYCDPPYKGTEEYQKGNFNHDEFYKWALNNEKPVFVSEYNMPDDFEIVASFHHKSTLSATNNNKIVIENLYWNKQ